MNKKIISIILIILINSSTFVYAEFNANDPTTWDYGSDELYDNTEVYNDPRFWGGTVNYDKVKWGNVNDFTRVDVNRIPKDEETWVSIGQGNIPIQKVGDIPAEYFNPDEVQWLGAATEEQIYLHLWEFDNLWQADHEKVHNVFAREYGVDIDISEAYNVRYDADTGKLVGEFPSYDPEEYPIGEFIQWIVGDTVHITRIGAEEITISGAEGFTRNADGSIDITLEAGKELKVTGPQRGIVTLDDGTVVRFENRGELIINPNGDIHANDAKVSLQRDFELVDTQSLSQLFRAQGFDTNNYDERKKWFEENYPGERYTGNAEQNERALRAIQEGGRQFDAIVIDGRFTRTGDVTKLESFDGRQSVFTDNLADITVNTVGYPLVVLPSGIGIPFTEYDFRGVVTYDDESFVSFGAFELEYTGIEFRTKTGPIGDTDVFRNQFFIINRLLSDVDRGDEAAIGVLNDPELKAFLTTPFAFHNSQQDFAFGQIEVEDAGIKYDGLTTTSQFKRQFSGNNEFVTIDGAQEGEIAKLTRKVKVGDITLPEGFVREDGAPEISATVRVDNEGKVLIDVDTSRLLMVAEYYLDPTKFLLVENNFMLKLDEGDGYFGINPEFGIRYESNEGSPTTFLSPSSTQRYLGETETAVMLAQAIVASREQYTQQGYLPDDYVNVEIDGKVVNGRILSVSSGRIVIDVGGNNVEIVGDSEIKGGVSRELLSERLEIYNRKPAEALALLQEYEVQHRGQRKGAEAMVMNFRLIRDFGSLLIGPREESRFDSWYNEFEENYMDSHPELVQIMGLEAAETELQENGLAAALNVYAKVVNTNPDSEIGQTVQERIQKLQTDQILQYSMIFGMQHHAQEMARTDRARSIVDAEELFGNVDSGFFSYLFTGISSVAPGNIVRDIFREDTSYGLEQSLQVKVEALEAVKHLIDNGYASDLKEAVDMVSYYGSLVKPRMGYGTEPEGLEYALRGSPLQGFYIYQIHRDFLMHDPAIQAGIRMQELSPTDPNRDQLLLLAAENYRDERNYQAAAMITSQLSQTASSPEIKEQAQALHNEILDPNDEWLNFADESLDSSSLFDIGAELVNPVSFLAYGTAARIVGMGLRAIPGGIRVLSVTGKAMEVPSRIIAGSSNSALRGYAGRTVGFILEEGAEEVAGVIHPAGEIFMMGLTGGADAIDRAQLAAKRAFRNAGEITVDTRVHVNGRVSSLYSYEGDINLDVLRQLGDVDVLDGVIRFRNTRTGEVHFYARKGTKLNDFDGSFVEAESLRQAASAQNAFETAKLRMAAASNADVMLMSDQGIMPSPSQDFFRVMNEGQVVPSPARERISPLSISDGSLRRITPVDKIDNIARRSTEIREGASIEPPSIRSVDLDISSREAYIHSIERYYEGELGLAEGSLSINAPDIAPRSGNEVFIVNHIDETGERNALLVKVFVREEPGAVPGAEAFREVEALSLLENNGLNVPRVVDVSYVGYPGSGETVVMVATEIVPGKSVASRIRDIGQTDGAQRVIALRGLEAQMSSVGEELSRFQRSVPSSEFSSSLDADVSKLRRHLRERFEAGQIDSSTYTQLERSIDVKFQEIEALGGTSSMLVHGDFHAGNVFVDGDQVTFIDVESTLESLSGGGSGILNPGNDYGRFMDNIQHHGTINGLGHDEMRSLEDAFLSSYSAHSGISKEELIKSIDLYKAKTSLVAMRYADSELERTAAFDRLKESLLGVPRSEIPSLTEPVPVSSLEEIFALAGD